MSEEVTATLLGSAYHQIERDGILATRLCTHKDDVELTNENKLQQLPGLRSSVWLFLRVWVHLAPGENWQNYYLGFESWFFPPQLDANCFSTFLLCSDLLRPNRSNQAKLTFVMILF